MRARGIVVATGGRSWPPGRAPRAPERFTGTCICASGWARRPSRPTLRRSRSARTRSSTTPSPPAGAQQPLIALNEMWGASLPMPLTPTAERYRENVLRFVSRLAERGARPALLVSSEPNTAGDAAAWWRSLAQVERPRARELRQRERHLARRSHSRIPSPADELSAVGREALRGGRSGDARGAHDRVPDRERARAGARG